jgi:hypothetical protein
MDMLKLSTIKPKSQHQLIGEKLNSELLKATESDDIEWEFNDSYYKGTFKEKSIEIRQLGAFDWRIHVGNCIFPCDVKLRCTIENSFNTRVLTWLNS